MKLSGPPYEGEMDLWGCEDDFSEQKMMPERSDKFIPYMKKIHFDVTFL